MSLPVLKGLFFVTSFMMGWFVAADAVRVPPTKMPAPIQGNDPPKEKVDPPPVQDRWCGIYECKGVAPNDLKYDYLVIIRKNGPVYNVQWISDVDMMVGAGYLDNNRLSVGWSVPNQQVRTIRGVTVYEMSSGGLKGNYVAVPGLKREGKETLTLIKSFEKGK